MRFHALIAKCPEEWEWANATRAFRMLRRRGAGAEQATNDDEVQGARFGGGYRSFPNGYGNHHDPELFKFSVQSGSDETCWQEWKTRKLIAVFRDPFNRHASRKVAHPAALSLRVHSP